MHFFTILPFVSFGAALLASGLQGPYAVSVTVRSLIDQSRMDPYAPTNRTHFRNLMVSIFTPVNSTKTPCQLEAIPYLTAAVAADYDLFGASVGLPNDTFSSLEIENCRVAPRCQCGCKDKNETVDFPLVLFSPGWGISRLLYGVMARSLASQGYVVVTIDHPYDAPVVEYPDGTVVRAVDISEEDVPAIEKLTMVRAADASFVIDQLKSPNMRKEMSKNYNTAISFDQIVMFGHSLGGATAAVTMHSDSRVLGGIDVDGQLFNPALDAGLDRPFILIGRPGHKSEDKTWETFWAQLRGARIEMAVNGTLHGSFTDYPAILDSVNLPESVRGQLENEIGSISGERMNSVIVGVLTAFCDLVFGLSVPELLREGSPKFPELLVEASDI